MDSRPSICGAWTNGRPPSRPHSSPTSPAPRRSFKPWKWRSTEHAVLEEVRTIVVDAAEQGPVVLIGHGGAKLLAGMIDRSGIFSILLHAGREWRIEQVMKRFECTRVEAADRVTRTDELRKRYVAHFFSVDLYDARSYDLVVDTERVGIDTATSIVLASVSSLSNA